MTWASSEYIPKLGVARDHVLSVDAVEPGIMGWFEGLKTQNIHI